MTVWLVFDFTSVLSSLMKTWNCSLN